jgi:hypothetical protein
MEKERVNRAGGPNLAAALLVAICLVAAPVSAEEPTGRAEADVTFQAARRLLEAGSVTEACSLFAASYALAPTAGRVLNLALCHEREGRIATACDELREAARLVSAAKAANPELSRRREELISEHLTALAPRLSKVTILLAPGALVPGLDIRLDGVPITNASLRAPHPLDPGLHTLTASSPGQTLVRQTWQAGSSGGSMVVTIPAPVPIAVPAKGQLRLVLGLTLGAIGLASLSTSVVRGLRAMARLRDSDADCQGQLCSREGLSAYHDGKRAAIVSDLTLGLGLTAVGASACFLVSAASRDADVRAKRRGFSARTLRIGATFAQGAGLSLRGEW